MTFRHPIRLFVSVVLGILLAGAAYFLTTRHFVRTVRIPESAASLPGPGVDIILSKTRAHDTPPEPALPRWAPSGDIKVEVPLPAPPFTAPGPRNPAAAVADRVIAGMPAAEVASPETASEKPPDVDRPVIKAPEVPAVALPQVQLAKPDVALPAAGVLSPPPLPRPDPSAQPVAKPPSLPVDTAPEIDLVTP